MTHCLENLHNCYEIHHLNVSITIIKKRYRLCLSFKELNSRQLRFCRFFSSIRLILFFLFYFIIPARANVMVRSCHYSFFFFRLHRSHEPPLFTFVANSSIYKYIFTQIHTRIPAYSFIHLKLSKNLWFDSFPNFFFLRFLNFRNLLWKCCFFSAKRNKKYIYRKRYARLFRYIFCYVNSI